MAKLTKKEKTLEEKISKDISIIRDMKYYNSVYNSVRDIEKYYYNNNYREDILLYRINKLETALMFQGELFSHVIGTLLAILFGLNFAVLFSFSDLMSYLIKVIGTILSFIVIGSIIVKVVKSNASPEQGRTNYLIKKEIEIITNLIEGKNERKYRCRRIR